jgi:hypothetical protein
MLPPYKPLDTKAISPRVRPVALSDEQRPLDSTGDHIDDVKELAIPTI